MSHSSEIPINVNDKSILEAIHHLIDCCGFPVDTFEAELVTQMIQTSLRLMLERHETYQIKLINRALKEMRYAYNVFNQYKKNNRCISIFGSSRTSEDHPDYIAAKAFGIKMAQSDWMCMTGAAYGIMKAGLEGFKRESSFGLSIRLPFELNTNNFIEGDPKSIVFRYFFTRKLMFLTHSDAVAVFPGGFGTMDELFEVLTLMQTGRAAIIPVVLVEGRGGSYWHDWKNYVGKCLLKNGWISPEDENFFYLASSEEDAAEHIIRFYSCYHSSRYVKDLLVIRLLKPLTEPQVKNLSVKFNQLVQSGQMELKGPFPEENDHLDLPRLVFHHTRRDFGLVRALIDAINGLQV